MIVDSFSDTENLIESTLKLQPDIQSRVSRLHTALSCPVAPALGRGHGFLWVASLQCSGEPFLSGMLEEWGKETDDSSMTGGLVHITGGAFMILLLGTGANEERETEKFACHQEFWDLTEAPRASAKWLYGLGQCFNFLLWLFLQFNIISERTGAFGVLVWSLDTNYVARVSWEPVVCCVAPAAPMDAHGA